MIHEVHAWGEEIRTPSDHPSPAISDVLGTAAAPFAAGEGVARTSLYQR